MEYPVLSMGIYAAGKKQENKCSKAGGRKTTISLHL